MVSVAEATRLIQQQGYRPATERVKIEEAVGRVLAEPVKADRDFPPFDRVSMDGIAINFQAIEDGWEGFRVEGLQQAGQPRLTLKNDKNCLEVMTGAMLPIGCDTVIRYEDVTVVHEMAKLKTRTVTRGQNVHTRAQDAKRGDTILSPGTRISPAEVALLAAVGWLECTVYRYPKIAIVSTGNELVDIHDRPLPHQIRRSNSYALRAALQHWACPSDLYHLPDDQNQMEAQLAKLFKTYEVVILSGGVSKGKFDLVPAALKALGVQTVFHRVSQKPGKPLFFGTTDRQVIFGLPGNPVSSFLCFYRYIRPWLMKAMGMPDPPEFSVLGVPVEVKPTDLTHFLQVKVRNEDGRLVATPVPGGGSGDFVNLTDVSGFLELPEGTSLHQAGAVFPFVRFRNDS